MIMTRASVAAFYKQLRLFFWQALLLYILLLIVFVAFDAWFFRVSTEREIETLSRFFHNRLATAERIARQGVNAPDALYHAFYQIDLAGNVIEAVPQWFSGANISSSGLFRKIAALENNQIYVTFSPDFTDFSHRLYFVLRRDDTFLAATYDPQTFFPSAAGSQIFIVDDHNVCLYAASPEYVGDLIDPAAFTVRRGRLYFARTRPMARANHLTLIIERDITTSALVVTAVVLVALLFFGLVHIRTMRLRLNLFTLDQEFSTLTEQIRSLSDGRYQEDAMAHPYYFSELADISREFCAMAAQILQREAALRESEKQYRMLVENLHEGIWHIDQNARTTFVNPRMAEMLGYRIDEMLGKHLFEFMDELGVEIAQYNLDRRQQGIREQHDFEFIRKDGRRVYTLLAATPLIDENGAYTGAIAGVLDITERKRAEEQLRASLQEKDVLLRELYHRTKNNMQVIRSMLVLQAASLKTPEVDKLVRDAERRIRTMSLAHHKLYQSQDLSRIRLDEYLTELVHLLKQSYPRSSEKIRLTLEMQPVTVLIDTALPCGLILNELLSNALQHAFPGDRQGTIQIRLFRAETGAIELHVADNGVGAPQGFDFRAQRTLGLQTIFNISEHQLKGAIVIETQDGVAARLSFTDNLYTARV